MSEAQLLAYAENCAHTVWQAEVELIRVAYQWAVTHHRDRLDPTEAAKPGREKARMHGGAGTPEVTEFAAAALGARIGRSTYAAKALMADALDLQHRLPQHWARVQNGEVRASYARHVAAKTRDLSKDEAASVDAAVAESADGRITWSRFELLVEAKVAAAAPALAKEKEERAAKARFAKKLRGEAHGMATFMVRADIATIDQLEASVTAKAAELKESMPDADEDDRRVRATLLMANPGATPETDVSDLLPTVVLHLHLYGGTTTGPEAEYDPETGPQTGSPAPRATARSPRPGSDGCWARTRSSRSNPSWTSPVRRRWMPTRSRTDIDRPCI